MLSIYKDFINIKFGLFGKKCYLCKVKKIGWYLQLLFTVTGKNAQKNELLIMFCIVKNTFFTADFSSITLIDSLI